jgi:histone H2A
MTKSKSATQKSNKSGTKGGSKTKSNKMTTADRAGVVFPPTRCTRLLKASTEANRVSAKAGVVTAAVLEYLVAEVFE